MAMKEAHRFFRLVSLVGEYFTIGEIVLRDTSGGPQIATGGTALSSSNLDAPRTHDKALDGNPSTHWHSAGAYAPNNWWGYDFGAGNAKRVSEIVFTQRATVDANWGPTQYRAEYSDDGVIWKPFRTGSAGPFPMGVAVTVDIHELLPSERKMRVYDLSSMRALPRQVALGRPDQPVFDPSKERWRSRHQLYHWANLDFGGLFKLDGTTTSLGIPAPRRVRLYHQFNGRLVGEQLTDEDGAFSFTHIEEGPWTVVGLDDTGAQNGVIFSRVKAVPMVL